MIDGSSAVDSVGEHTARAGAWRIAAPAAVVAMLALLAIYRETVLFTVDFWKQAGAYSHGYLLPLISASLVWRDRRRIARLTPRIRLSGLAAIGALSLLWALATFIDVQVVMQLSLLLMVAALLWTLVGRRAFRVLAFPVGYLVLGIPVWSLLIPTLQTHTAVAATEMLQFLGVPVFLDGYYMNIPSGQFVVEEVCSGLRYLLATLCIASLYAYLNMRRASFAVLFVALAALLSVLFNWLRVMAIVYAGYASDMQHALVTDHITFGWVTFAVGLLPMFALGWWLQSVEGPEPDEDPALEPDRGAAPAPPRRLLAAAATGLVLGAAGPAVAHWLAGAPGPAPRVELSAPRASGGWTGPLPASPGWRPRFIGASAEVLADYEKAGVGAGLFIAFYARQSQDAELVNERNAFYDSHRWKRRASRDRALGLADGTLLHLGEIELVSAAGEERLLWYWYQLGTRRTTSGHVAKLMQLWNTVTGTPQGAAVAMSVPSRDTLAAARAELEDFARGVAPEVAASLARAAER